MKLRILVVDDDEDLLFLAEQLLHVQGEELDLVKATTAQAAVQLLDEGNLDAVICDFHLGPDQMNGLEILEWVRDEEIDIPFIIFTGHSREEIAIKALNLGADYYIEKSDDLEGLFIEIGYHIRKVVRSKRTEEALQESEQRLRTLVQSLNDLIFVVDSENRFSQYHSVSREELFQPPEKFIGKHISEVLPPSIAGTYVKLVLEARASGKRQSFDYKLKVNGEKKWYTADLDLHEDKESIVVAVKDISERKEAELELQKSELRNRIIVGTMSDLVLIFDSENKYREYYGDASLLVESWDEMKGKETKDLIHHDISSVHERNTREVRDTGESVTYEYELEIQGIVRWMQSTMMLHEDKESIVVAVTEISKRKQAELDLRKAEREWRNTFDSIPDLVSVLNSDFEIIKANKIMADFLGVPPEELIGKKCYELMHRSSEPFPGCPHIETNKTGLPASAEISDPCMGRPHLCTTSPILDDQGDQVGVVHIAKDISERVEAERTIKESESQFRAIFNEAGIGMALVMNGHILEANSALLKLLGYDENEIKGLTIDDITHPYDRGDDSAALQDLMASDKKSYELEKRYIRKDGEIVWGKLTVSLIRDPEGTQDYAIGMVEDITEQKKAEEQRRESEEKFRAMFESAGIGMTIVGVDDQIIDANTAYQDLVGFNIDELRKMTIADFTHPDDVLTDTRLFEEVSQGKRDSYHMVKRYIRKDEEMIWVHLTVTVVKDENDEITFIVGMAEDVTARREAETALSESEQKYRTLIENVQSGIQITQNGIIVFANEILTEMLGYTTDEIVGSPFSNLIAPEDLEWVTARYRKRLAGEEVPSEYDLRVLHKNGSLKQVRVKIANFEYEGKLSTIATITDVTERRKAEDELRDSELRYRLLFENLSDGLFITNSEGIITMCSPQGARLFGGTPDEIIGSHFSYSIHPDHKERLVYEFQRGFENRETQPSGHEVRGIRPDGSEFDYHITNTLLMENGEPVGYQSLIRDITELKEIENDLRNSELRYRQIIESTPIGMHMYELDENDRLIFVGANPAADKLLGLDHNQFIGKSIEEAFPSAAETDLPHVYKEVALKGVPWSSEQVDYADDKISGAFEVHAFQTMPRKMVASFLEITERKLTEQAVAISQENFHTVFETIDDFLFIVGLDAKILTANHTVRDRLGYSKEELHGLDVLTVHPPDRREEAADILKEMMEGKTTVCPVPLMTKDGTIIPVETRITLGRWSGEDVLFGVSRDITQRISTEEVLKRRTHDLGERVKELTCLYEATSLLRNPNLSERDVFQNLVGLLPPAWQYPEATCARITINGNEYSTPNFRQSKWKQTSEIKAFGRTIGNIEVYYTEEKPDHFEGPFLKEERNLIDALAKHLCEFSERHISGKALRESEDRYRSLIENIPVVSWTSDSEGNTVFISPNVKEIYGYSEEEIIEAGDELWFSRIHPDDVERVKRAYAKVFDSNKEFNVEYRIKTKEGNWIWLLDWSTQTYELDGRRMASGVFMDITQRKRMQEILKASEEEAQRYLDIVGSMILTIDHEGIVTRINRRGCEILGYEAEEIIGLNWIDNFIPMRQRAEIKEVHSKAMSGRIAEVEEYENPVLTKSGEEKLLAWRNVTLFDDDGNIRGAISSAVDITERNRTEKKLRTEMEFTEAALNSQRDTFFVFDPQNGKAIRWNKVFQQISEYSDDEIASMKAPDSYYDSDDLEKANFATQNLMKEGRATLELKLITKSGKRIPFEYEASLMRVNDNNEYIVSVGRDMTERKNAEKAIEQQLDFLENVLESLSHPFYVIDVNDYTIKLANKVARLGNLEENPTCHFVTHRSETPCSPNDHPCPLEEVKRTKRPVVVDHKHFDENGNVRDMEVHAYPILDDNGSVVQMIEYALDITGHKQALRALEDNEKRFRELYENAPLGYQTLDERAHIINVNQAWLDALGYSLEDVAGKFFGNFLTAESKQKLESNFAQFKLEGCIDNIEYEMIRKDGSRLIARFNGRVAHDEDGNFKHTHCIFQDVTEWKYADNLLRRQKEELSELAHIMSHDLGNKMKNIRTLISLLKREYNEEVIERIDSLAKQTSELLQSSATLADSGLVVERSEFLDLNQVVQEIATTVIPDNIAFEMDALPKIQGDSQRITQIIQNLLVNAVEHGHPKLIEVRKGTSRVGISLLVINDGEIIPDDIKGNIFQRGFTTKGQGRGLGLTIVKKLVEAHGWTIEIELTDKTIFKINIPKSSIRS